LNVGLDTNILCYALDPAYPEHSSTQDLLLTLSSKNTVSINPTVIHETYHVLVFYSQWIPKEASDRLKMLLQHPYIRFHSQTKQTSKIALSIATEHNLGGRDALIIANFLQAKIPTIYTHDTELSRLGSIKWKTSSIEFTDPLSKN
jgi:predicted nucleic acid-binding protein